MEKETIEIKHLKEYAIGLFNTLNEDEKKTFYINNIYQIYNNINDLIYNCDKEKLNRIIYILELNESLYL